MSGFLGPVRFSVRRSGEEMLVYHFDTNREAIKMLHFLRDFFPDAQFVVEPALH